MVALSQKIALELVPELLDDSTAEKGWTHLQQVVERGEGRIVANVIVRGLSGSKATASSGEELLYPSEFDPPQVPKDIPKEKLAEVVKSWPLVGIRPSAFETRKLGPKVETELSASDDGVWVSGSITAQDVRLLRYAKYEVGVLASGEHLTVEMPIFHSLESMLTVQLKAGQKLLFGVHNLPAGEGMELFILRISTQRTGAAKQGK